MYVPTLYIVAMNTIDNGYDGVPKQKKMATPSIREVVDKIERNPELYYEDSRPIIELGRKYIEQKNILFITPWSELLNNPGVYYDAYPEIDYSQFKDSLCADLDRIKVAGDYAIRKESERVCIFDNDVLPILISYCKQGDRDVYTEILELDIRKSDCSVSEAFESIKIKQALAQASKKGVYLFRDADGLVDYALVKRMDGRILFVHFEFM